MSAERYVSTAPIQCKSIGAHPARNITRTAIDCACETTVRRIICRRPASLIKLPPATQPVHDICRPARRWHGSQLRQTISSGQILCAHKSGKQKAESRNEDGLFHG